jgi:cytidine deaminase
MRAATSQERSLHALADEARRNAYARYSNFPVGAALLFDDGTTVTGVNVEDAVFPLGICAERAAVARAHAEAKGRIVAVAVSGTAASCPPCGGCRQVLSEHAVGTTPVTFPYRGDLITLTVDELLPYRFQL